LSGWRMPLGNDVARGGVLGGLTLLPRAGLLSPSEGWKSPDRRGDGKARTAADREGSPQTGIRVPLKSAGDGEDCLFSCGRPDYLQPKGQAIRARSAGDGDRGHTPEVHRPRITQQNQFRWPQARRILEQRGNARGRNRSCRRDPGVDPLELVPGFAADLVKFGESCAIRFFGDTLAGADAAQSV